MLARFFSAFLAFLLAGSLLWGPCAACAAAPLKATGHGCCAHHTGNCKMPAPKQPAAKICPNLALVPTSHHDSNVPQLASPAVAITVEAPAVAVAAPVRAVDVNLDTSPPGIYLLNSVLLV